MNPSNLVKTPTLYLQYTHNNEIQFDINLIDWTSLREGEVTYRVTATKTTGETKSKDFKYSICLNPYDFNSFYFKDG